MDISMDNPWIVHGLACLACLALAWPGLSLSLACLAWQQQQPTRLRRVAALRAATVFIAFLKVLNDSEVKSFDKKCRNLLIFYLSKKYFFCYLKRSRRGSFYCIFVIDFIYTLRLVSSILEKTFFLR